MKSNRKLHNDKIARREEYRQSQAVIAEQNRLAREKFEREHPVLSGAVKVVEYREPNWRYVPPVAEQKARQEVYA